MEERFAALKIPADSDVVSINSDTESKRNVQKFNRPIVPTPNRSNSMRTWLSEKDSDFKKYKFADMFDEDIDNEYVFILIPL